MQTEMIQGVPVENLPRAVKRAMRRVPAMEPTPIRAGRRRTSKPRAFNSDAHPIVKEISRICDERGIGRKVIADMAGLGSRVTVRDWHLYNARPCLPVIDSVVNALGYRLSIRRIGHVRRELLGTKANRGPQRYLNPETHPAVREIIRLCDTLGISLKQACGLAGVKYTTVKAWWGSKGNQPALDRIDALFHVLGFELCLEPIPA